MLISYNWLNELVTTGLNPLELSEKLTQIGLEIDGVHEKKGDTIYDIEVTSNRGDCLSHLGAARELSAVFAKEIDLPSGLSDSPETTGRVKIDNPELCHRFTSRIIRSVKVGPSPDWLVSKLEAVGERSINNIADITNLVMHEFGQPMHAFDLKKLAGERIIVRNAAPGESIKTLDEEDRKLDESILAICDEEKPVAIAGVMGGFDTGVTDKSTDVLLEVAYFDRDSIRSTSARLNLSTEASYRFERGVDIENLVRASNRASSLISELADGIPEEFTDVYPTKQKTVTIEAADLESEFKRLTGNDLEGAEINRFLNGLGIAGPEADIYTVPTWRHDLAIPEDLVEEAARMHGYDKIGEELPYADSAGEYHELEPRKRGLRAALAANGFDEAMSYSFVDAEKVSIFSTIESQNGSGSSEVRINDPIIEGADLMRPTLLSGMLDAVQTNFNHKALDLRLFEIGRVFLGGEGNELPSEKEFLAIVITGSESFENTAARGREYDFYDLKAAVEQSLNAIGIESALFSVNDEAAHLQKGQSANIVLDNEVVGTVGKLEGGIAASFKFRQPVFVAELNLSRLLAEPAAIAVYNPLAIFPSVTRDVSLVVPDAVSLDQILRVVKMGGFNNFAGVEYVATYSGEGIEATERSVTIRIEYRSPTQTLTDEEVDEAHSKVIAELETSLGATFR